jgi:hypothetical protein
MFGQFVVHLDYMLSAGPACRLGDRTAGWGTMAHLDPRDSGIFLG